MGGKAWDTWNKAMREQLPANQVKTGPQAGSWNPAGDKWGGFGGRLYVTCLCIYNLEVYYRHLPLYSSKVFTPVDETDAAQSDKHDGKAASEATSDSDETPAPAEKSTRASKD